MKCPYCLGQLESWKPERYTCPVCGIGWTKEGVIMWSWKSYHEDPISGRGRWNQIPMGTLPIVHEEAV